MGVPIVRLDPDRVAQRRLFPDWIEDDDWVMFHGTSGFNADSIERNGFEPARVGISSSQLTRVLAVFEKMKWWGDHGGGYPILKPFSLGYDFRDPDRSPIFFAETSMRALVFATRDFSGGEKLRALRYAFADLEAYLSDGSLRQRHFDLLKAEFDNLSALNASQSTIEAVRPVVVDLSWLRQELENLAEVRRIADDAVHRHGYGIVYAMRIAEGDVKRLHWNPMMGVEATTRISPSTIVGKAIVPPEYEPTQQGRTVNDRDRTTRGLFASLQKAVRNSKDS